MAKRSEIAEQLVLAIGVDATEALIRERGGKVIRIPDGSGRAGAFTAWLEEVIGGTALGALMRTFGGEFMTVPKCQSQAIAARNALIVADYDGGTNILELIQKYGLGERQLRNILNRPAGEEGFRGAMVDDKQLGLF